MVIRYLNDVANMKKRSQVNSFFRPKSIMVVPCKVIN
jgi:hypothetical protein